MELSASLAENRARVEEFLGATRGVAGAWTAPVRPGKWSPAEVAEHINLSYRQTTELLEGRPAGFPNLPFFLRPLLRRFAFRPVLATGRFGRPVKTFASFTPTDLARDPAEAEARLRSSLERFEAGVRSVTSPIIRHPAFGTIAVSDYVLFQAIHTRHHQGQLTA